MKEYAFDVKLFATIRVNAKSEKEARRIYVDALDGASANLGAWADGAPILCEVTLDDPSFDELIEVNGEAHIAAHEAHMTARFGPASMLK